MTNSVCDENFLNVGNKDGIIIWRIEDFKLTSLNPSEYGKLNFFLILFVNLENGQEKKKAT